MDEVEVTEVAVEVVSDLLTPLTFLVTRGQNSFRRVFLHKAKYLSW